MKPTLSHPAISDPKAVVAVYNTHAEAEAGVRELQKGAFWGLLFAASGYRKTAF